MPGGPVSMGITEITTTIQSDKLKTSIGGGTNEINLLRMDDNVKPNSGGGVASELPQGDGPPPDEAVVGDAKTADGTEAQGMDNLETTGQTELAETSPESQPNNNPEAREAAHGNHPDHQGNPEHNEHPADQSASEELQTPERGKIPDAVDSTNGAGTSLPDNTNRINMQSMDDIRAHITGQLNDLRASVDTMPSSTATSDPAESQRSDSTRMLGYQYAVGGFQTIFQGLGNGINGAMSEQGAAEGMGGSIFTH